MKYDPLTLHAVQKDNRSEPRWPRPNMENRMLWYRLYIFLLFASFKGHSEKFSHKTFVFFFLFVLLFFSFQNLGVKESRQSFKGGRLFMQDSVWLNQNLDCLDRCEPGDRAWPFNDNKRSGL